METDKIKRIVIWGLKKRYHTHRHIHQAFYKNAKKLGYSALWVEDEKKNKKYIKPGDLIIASEVIGKMIPEKNNLEDYNLPIRDDVKYCLHNYKDIFINQLNQENYIRLQVYTNDAEKSDIKIDTARYFDTKTKTLYQPWGTDLLPQEFKKPTFNKNKFVFWVGSIWNNNLNQGNIDEINELKKVLSNHNIKFINIRFIPNWLNIFLVRISRIAPAITGKYQIEINYLPCRMFKNISYGQLGFTNIKKFKDILGESFIDGEKISEIVIKALLFEKDEYKKIIIEQQKIVRKYTYLNSLENIIRFTDK